MTKQGYFPISLLDLDLHREAETYRGHLYGSYSVLIFWGWWSHCKNSDPLNASLNPAFKF